MNSCKYVYQKGPLLVGQRPIFRCQYLLFRNTSLHRLPLLYEDGIGIIELRMAFSDI